MRVQAVSWKTKMREREGTEGGELANYLSFLFGGGVGKAEIRE
jgi:hypothetical protein